MFTAGELKGDVSRVLGGVDDATAFARLTDAVEILAAESDWDPLRAFMDVCVQGDCVTLPRQVETVLAVNIDGQPSQAHDFWFQFHLNGPGSNMERIGYHWMQTGPVCVFRDPPATGARLVATVETLADNNARLRVFGYDVAGNWIRTANSNGTVEDGFLVPTSFGNPTVNPLAPPVRTITRVSKSETSGVVSLHILNPDNTLTRIGQYFPKETEPQYRRIKLNRTGARARIAFKRDVEKITQDTDLVPLHSRYAVVLMAKALKKFDDDRIEEGEQYRQMAIDLLRKKQLSVEVPGGPSIQIADGNLIADRRDRMT